VNDAENELAMGADISSLWGKVPFQSTKAICLMSGEKGVSGQINFEQKGDSVRLVGELKGLPPNTDHGFHIHEFGDLSNGCTSAGEHFNPDTKPHGAPTDKNRHCGDLGNVVANEKGVAKIDITDNYISLKHNKYCIVGRALVVHEQKDDLGRGGNPASLLTGNAGGRLACGIIGLQTY